MNPPAHGLDRPVVALPIQVFPRPCEGAETFIARLAHANYLKPFYLRAYLCDPPMTAGAFSWSRLAAATGRDPVELQDVLERIPPPPPDLLLCEYCGRPPRPNVEAGPAPWWCSARCRRRDDLLKSAPSSNSGPRSAHAVPVHPAATAGTFVRNKPSWPSTRTRTPSKTTARNQVSRPGLPLRFSICLASCRPVLLELAPADLFSR